MEIRRLATAHGLALEVRSLYPLRQDGTPVEAPLVDCSVDNRIRFTKACVAVPVCLPDRW